MIFRRKQSAEQRGGSPRRLPRLRHVVLALLLLGAAGVAALTPGWIAQLEAARFSELVVRGRLQHVTPAQVHAAAAPYLDDGFLAVDMDGLRKAVEALPWVAQARMRREWPGTLYITITEEAPVAVWRARALLNGQGKVFLQETAGYADALPDLHGPEGTQLLMLQAWAGMQQALAPLEANVARVTLSERRAWRLQLAGGIEVRLGRSEANRRLLRFARVALPALRPELERVNYVDMRYTNGFAVSWKRPANTTGA